MLAELRKIRELLTHPPPPPPPKGLPAEFKAFLSEYKVLGLAVAFILAVYLGGVVQALVKDLILPIVGIPLSSVGDLSVYSVPFANQNFKVGDFLVALITFLIVVLVIFVLSLIHI